MIVTPPYGRNDIGVAERRGHLVLVLVVHEEPFKIFIEHLRSHFRGRCITNLRPRAVENTPIVFS